MQKKQEDEKDCRSYKLKCNLPETLETLLLPGSSNQAVKTTRGGREKADTGENTETQLNPEKLRIKVCLCPFLLSNLCRLYNFILAGALIVHLKG